MIRRLPHLFAPAAVALALLASPAGAGGAAAQEAWVIRSFDTAYVIDESGTVSVTEDIRVDFGSLERHGIFRDIVVKQRYDDESNRVYDITNLSVTDGSGPVTYEVSDDGANQRIRIGDEDVLVSGEQRYVIIYTLHNALNPFDDHDELYWNVTGGDWEATIERASATVTMPGPGIEQSTCFQGPTGSADVCEFSFTEMSALFETRSALPPGSELTVVVGLRKGLVEVGLPVTEPRSISPTPNADSLYTPEAGRDGFIENSSESEAGINSVLLLGLVAGVALGGALTVVVAMLFVRRRFLRY